MLYINYISIIVYRKGLQMNYIYPAIFHLNDDNKTYTIVFPDLPGCMTQGLNLSNALYIASDALKTFLEVCEEVGQEINPPSSIESIKIGKGEFVNLVQAEIRNTASVKRTVSLPQWLDDRARKEGISLSKLLQDSLKKKFA